jgi:YHS domain-containing protein
MTEMDDLEQRIKERLAVSEEGRRLRENHLQEVMKQWEDRHARYTAVADHLMQVVIRPRIEKLKDHFDNATLPEARNSRHTSFCEFAHCPRFPATVRLEFAVTRDGEATTLIVQCNVEILPVFIQFEARDQLCMQLEAVTEDKVTAWVEDKILGFVDTYLKLETADPYQSENMVTDPVCGMHINRNHAAASMEYRGVPYYFCLEECRARFSENPARYVKGG